MKWLKWTGIVLAALIIVPLITLLALGHRAGAGTMQAGIDINASPEQVWAWIDEADKLKQWIGWVVDVRYPNPQKTMGLGASRVFVMKDQNNGGAIMQITGENREYAPPQKMTVHLSDADGMFAGDQSYQLTDLGNGHTHFEVHSRFRYSQWLPRLMEPVITPAAEKKMAMDIGRLKSLIEAKASVR